ncbi:MAG TPA: CAP domain-containing protein [Solirubrobacteraceae bacterium]|nr:CAP domain-containing protein [Solirubrobacteraceae bacterium]
MPGKLLLTLLLTAVVLLMPAVAPPVHRDGEAQASSGECQYQDTLPRSSTTLRRAEKATLCLVNRERTSRGLRALASSTALDKASREYARGMVRHRFFAHVTPGGGTLKQRIRESGYLDGARSYNIGENLAWGSGSWATPRRRVASWMDSPGHRANILNPGFRHLGVGLSTGAPKRTSLRSATYVTHFGQRAVR